MKIYRIKNVLGNQIYIIANNINNAVKIFEKQCEKDKEDTNIKEIEFIGFCIIGD